MRRWEASLAHDGWALLREITMGDKDIDRAITDLCRPGALTASLNWYRANVPVPGPGTDGKPAPWSLAAFAYMALLEAFLEPDPDWTPPADPDNAGRRSPG